MSRTILLTTFSEVCDARAAELENKVSALKEISLEIAEESQTSEKVVSSMVLDIDETSGLLQGTMKRLRAVAERPGTFSALGVAVAGFILFILSLYLLAVVARRLGYFGARGDASQAAGFLGSTAAAPPPAA